MSFCQSSCGFPRERSMPNFLHRHCTSYSVHCSEMWDRVGEYIQRSNSVQDFISLLFVFIILLCKENQLSALLYISTSTNFRFRFQYYHNVKTVVHFKVATVFNVCKL